MNNIGAFCVRHRKWLIVLGVLVGVAVMVAVVQAAMPEPKTMAELPGETEVTFDLEENPVYKADDGVIVIPASETQLKKNPANRMANAIVDSPEAMWQDSGIPESRNYTLPEQAQLADGSIGVLSISKLGLTVGVFESNNEMEAMTHGLAHFKTTSAWAGNIGLCGHNVNFNLTDGYFKRLHTLAEGDTISYKTALGSRSYTVTAVKEIAASDWSDLGRTEDNRITMVTCISGKPDSRLLVQAVEN